VRDLAMVQESVKPIASPVSEITVSARGAWRVLLASGLVLEVGRSDIGARLGRFAAAWPQLAAAGTQTRHADLRSANGFALRTAANEAVAKPASPNRHPPKNK
jgi:cell division protein FtsQ